MKNKQNVLKLRTIVKHQNSISENWSNLKDYFNFKFNCTKKTESIDAYDFWVLQI